MTLHQPYTAGHGLEPQDAIVIAGPQRDGGIAQSEFSRETLQNSWVGIAPSVQGATMRGLDFRRVQTGQTP